MTGAEVAVTWRGHRVRAWVPDPLSRRDLTLTPAVALAVGRATELARLSSNRFPTSWEVLARLILRAEGAASSAIEGIRAHPVELAAAQGGLRTAGGDALDGVVDNLRCLDAALDHAADPSRPLSIDALLGWHELLMARSGLPARMVGAVRDEQGWIGGTSPLDAVAVTPPPDRLPSLMDDLVTFRGAPPEEIDPLTAAAVGHAQFELIHPFADGNGRLGRVLLLWTLTRHLALLHPPPVSMVIERQRGAYLAGLQQFRLGMVGAWVQWCAAAVGDAATHVDVVRGRIEDLAGRHTSATASLRADSAARALVPQLAAHPVLTAASAAALVGVSPRAARDALAALAAAGVVERTTPAVAGRGRPEDRWVVTGVFDALRI